MVPHHPLLAVLDAPKETEFLDDLGIAITDPGSSDPKLGSSILELAQALADHLAWEPFEDEPSEANPSAEAAIEYLQCVTQSDLEIAISRLPVFPAVAQRALRLLTTEDWKAADIQRIAASDQVLAADLIRAANCCTCGARQPITTLGHAITYLGAEHASTVLLAACVKRLFAPTRLRAIWNHSLDAAETARSLARISKQANPDEAFLAGLVHDIGRLAMALLPERFQLRYANLLDQGCELALVERVLCGSTHAQIGADALKRWRFPSPLVDAVRFHHRPEQSKSALAAILYLMERCTNPRECPGSLSRSKAALDRLRLAPGFEFSLEPQQHLNSLRFC